MRRHNTIAQHNSRYFAGRMRDLGSSIQPNLVLHMLDRDRSFTTLPSPVLTLQPLEAWYSQEPGEHLSQRSPSVFGGQMQRPELGSQKRPGVPHGSQPAQGKLRYPLPSFFTEVTQTTFTHKKQKQLQRGHRYTRIYTINLKKRHVGQYRFELYSKIRIRIPKS